MSETGSLLFLRDIKGFVGRKLFILEEDRAVLIETRIDDKKTFVNELSGIEAVKTIYREKKRVVKVFPKIDESCLDGWVYGVNVQIKNKKGQVSQIRQYASNFNGKKKLVKKIYC